MLQQDGVIGHERVAMRRRCKVLLHVDAVLVVLHGHVHMRGSIGAWHKQSPGGKLQHRIGMRKYALL